MTQGSRIAIIGTGNVGAPLGRRLAGLGYRVVFGARDVGAAREKLQGIQAEVALPKDAAVGADMVLLTVPANVALGTARALELAPGTILVDCTNPLRWDGGPVWAPPAEGSMTAALAAALPGVRVVKGFSHFGAEVHDDPVVSGMAADMFVAGDDQDARQAVLDLGTALGYHAQDAGPLRNAALLENLAVLWIQLATTGRGRQFAFKAVGR
ncbi:MAG: NAD(P)-binding domain-containing protein [Acidobacteria bacterium]|nr:NAD(P)-binding domain-containing protein [Acidobacteriota bacterium]